MNIEMLKKNMTQVVLFGAVVVIDVILIVVYMMMDGEVQQKKLDLENLKNEAQAVSDSQIALNDDNLQIAKKNLANIQAEFDQVYDPLLAEYSIALSSRVMDVMGSSTQAKAAFEDQIKGLRDLVTAGNRLSVPEDFQFSFDRKEIDGLLNSSPEVRTLAFEQLEVINRLCRAMMDAEVAELKSISRSKADAAKPPAGALGTTYQTFSMEVRGSHEAMQKYLNTLMKMKGLYLRLNYVNLVADPVANADLVPLLLETLKVAPDSATDASAPAPSVTVVKGAQPRAIAPTLYTMTLSVDCIKFTSKKETRE